jgi:hypothetical protein
MTTRLARILTTGAAAAVLTLAGTGAAMADDVPPLPTYPDCPGASQCVPSGAPGSAPALPTLPTDPDCPGPGCEPAGAPGVPAGDPVSVPGGPAVPGDPAPGLPAVPGQG